MPGLVYEIKVVKDQSVSYDYNNFAIDDGTSPHPPGDEPDEEGTIVTMSFSLIIADTHQNKRRGKIHNVKN